MKIHALRHFVSYKSHVRLHINSNRRLKFKQAFETGVSRKQGFFVTSARLLRPLVNALCQPNKKPQARGARLGRGHDRGLGFSYHVNQALQERALGVTASTICRFCRAYGGSSRSAAEAACVSSPLTHTALRAQNDVLNSRVAVSVREGFLLFFERRDLFVGRLPVAGRVGQEQRTPIETPASQPHRLLR